MKTQHTIKTDNQELTLKRDLSYEFHCGDCIEIMQGMEQSSIDLILTDPPYNLGLFMHRRDTNLKKMRENQFAYSGWDNLEYKEWSVNMDSFFEESARLLKKRGALLLFMSIIKVESIIALAQKHGFYYKTTGVWHKTNPMPRNMNLHFVNSTEAWVYFIHGGSTGTFNNNGKLVHDFFETSVTPQGERKQGVHPTQKPLKIFNSLVELLTNKGEVVLDPFMGSGTTGVSCKLKNRSFIGIDSHEPYVEIAKKRIEK